MALKMGSFLILDSLWRDDANVAESFYCGYIARASVQDTMFLVPSSYRNLSSNVGKGLREIRRLPSLLT